MESRLIQTSTQRNKFASTQVGKLTRTDQNSYFKMIEEMLKYNKEHDGFKLNLACDKTLLELMHSQTRFELQTFDEGLDQILLNKKNEKNNDTLEMLYTKNYTITPILFKLIINMSSPSDICGIRVDYFTSRKTVIFDYSGIMNRKIFEEEYVIPFFNEIVLPMITEESTKLDTQFFQLPDYSELYLDYSTKLFDNIIIIQYLELVELLLKIHDLPNIIRKIKEVSLVIIDSMNLILNQSLQYEYDDSTEDNRKSNVMLDKKKRKSLNKDEISITEQINKVLNQLQKEFNFNLIYTLFDFQRVSDLNFFKYKANMTYDNKRYYKITMPGSEHAFEFLFQLRELQDSHKILTMEPNSNYVYNNTNMFAVLVYMGDGLFTFRIFLKKRKVNECKLVLTTTLTCPVDK